jgi:hypothetical protein
MADWIRQHMQHLRRGGAISEGAGGAAFAQRRLRVLREAEGVLRGVVDRRGSLREAHAKARESTVRRLSGVLDREFPNQPPAGEWVRRSLDARETVWAYRRCLRRLRGFLQVSGVRPVALYGGIKPREGRLGKIAAFEAGEAELDLWDVVRFRIVTEGIRQLAAVCERFVSVSAGDVGRCRNYYLRPRHGESDPYRAVHFELRDSEGWWTEVQVVTAMRDAVGWVDHALVCKKGVAFANRAHAEWLYDLSLAGNVWDAEDQGRG